MGLAFIVFLFVVALIVGSYFAINTGPAGHDGPARARSAVERRVVHGLVRRGRRKRRRRSGDDEENENRHSHHRTSVTPSNMSAGR